MGLKCQLGITFININSTRDQINSLIILSDYRSDTNSVNSLITRLFNRSLAFGEVNSAAYNHARMGIYSVQEYVNGIIRSLIIPPIF
jgi:hypothetical protein